VLFFSSHSAHPGATSGPCFLRLHETNFFVFSSVTSVSRRRRTSPSQRLRAGTPFLRLFLIVSGWSRSRRWSYLYLFQRSPLHLPSSKVAAPPRPTEKKCLCRTEPAPETLPVHPAVTSAPPGFFVPTLVSSFRTSPPPLRHRAHQRGYLLLFTLRSHSRPTSPGKDISALPYCLLFKPGCNPLLRRPGQLVVRLESSVSP